MPLLYLDLRDVEIPEYPGGQLHDFVTEEAPHILASVAINLVARNPYVWVGTMLAHAGYHLLSEYLDSGSSSSSYQQNGGPETKSTYKPSGGSPTPGARSVFRTGGRRSGSKPRKRCPTGFHWNGRRCVKR